MKRPPFVQSLRKAEFRDGLYRLICGHSVRSGTAPRRRIAGCCRPHEVVCPVCLRGWMASVPEGLRRRPDYRELAALIADEEPPSVGTVRVERQPVLPGLEASA